jgi:putative N6-adenine-specific DNA methylase
LAKLQLIAACAMGLEAVVARELKELGYDDMMVENGRVTFAGEEKDICRANLWLRTADRILVKMAEFPARTFEELFQGVKSIPWQDWIPVNGEFPVEGRSHKSILSSVPACQAVAKKAVVEKLKLVYKRERFEETGPRYTIEVALLNDLATITLDTTGPSLHKRGYRKLVTEAPLKETLAAAMVLISRWTPDRPLYDPFCGSGTIPIEAAMIGWNIAPGLRRSFPSERWHRVPEELWNAAREEAYDALQDDSELMIVGSDIDPAAIEIARAAAKKAGLAGEIRFEVLPVAKMRPTGNYGVIITNPPYGERLGNQKEAEAALKQLAYRYQLLDNWSAYVLSPSKNVEHYMEQKADRKRKLYNGRIECQLYQYYAAATSSYYKAKREGAI